MAVQHANLGIVENNLQLYYNREWSKSFRGQAATNYVDELCANHLAGGAGSYWVSTITSDTSTGYNAYKVVPLPGGYQYTTGSWTTTGIIAGLGGYLPPGTYSLSAKVLLPKGSTFIYGFRYYPLGEEFPMSVIGTGSWQTIKRENITLTGYNSVQFQMVPLAENGTSSGNSPIYPGNPFYVRDIMINSGSYAVPFSIVTNRVSARPENTTNITLNSNFASSISGVTTGGTQSNWTFSSWSGTGNAYATQSSTSIYSSGTVSYSAIPLRVTRATAGAMDFFSTSWNTLTNGTVYTLSFWARANTDSVSGLEIQHQNLGLIKGYAVNSYWGRYCATFTHAGGTQYPYLRHNASSGNWFEIADVQLEAKSYPTDFTTTNRTSIANTATNGGGLLDISGNKYTADLNSAAVAFDSGGFYFNGDAAGALTTPVAGSILDGLSNNTHTYECWFKLLGTPPGSSDGYFFGRQGFHEGFFHAKSNPNYVYIQTWYSDNLASSLGTILALNTWYYGVYVADVENATRKLYINGSVFDSNTLTKQLKQYASGTPYYVGSANPVYSSNIIVSVVRAYNRALTDSEIQQNFNAQRKTYGI
jgi:hypothetical protein